MPEQYWPLILKIGQIIWINVLLSGDNAVVIALACRGLPPESRRTGILAGSAAAIGLRILFTLVIVQLLALPYLKLISGVLLLWIAVKLIIDEENHGQINASTSMWTAVRTIAIADAVMSLDNVVAIAAIAQDSMWLIVLGLLMSMPLIVFGSTAMLALINRYPAIIWLGAAMLGWVAGELLISDPLCARQLGSYFHQAEQFAGPVGAVLTLAIGWGMVRWRGRAPGPA